VREFFAKIARHAFGKGAAFCYAVTVAVSGQLAYNYLQPRMALVHDNSVMGYVGPLAGRR